MLNNAILIAGPTASGKSALALALAQETGGVVINADSMQVYDVLSLLTARPSAEDLKRVPHFLYGHVSPSVAYSTGAWLDDVAKLVESGALEGKRPVFVGGTGLYFRALLEGIAPVPPVPDAVRRHWRQRMEKDGPEALHGLLAERDPDAASAIGTGDAQRITRALEVFEASGRPLSAWQQENTPPLVDRASSRCIVLEPEREFVRQRIGQRFDRMVEEGALEEVKALLALDLPPELPAMKAIGVPELAACLANECALEDAIERAKTATRRYSKRQGTWFRNQLGEDWLRVPLSSENALPRSLAGVLQASAKPAE
ncbi:tRNA (adenosine(37)-N6)-dimethylallyltransferase MiaA [Nitratireductor aquibiodomus]|uniref:tRNA (adenosine(37)-N6)-dimethylallyltransferase MiaA n=1 Tax=Nitratireductor aquibiodomus TaxID=204799 RepID=UPI0019D34240|nr:tRNA (adenosine(37)-N6)-dimethylallyltransferase MiaA [Nitratireductor aquibiodomus]MBN7762789.1 tRNA (adenosine(37)-N6)-dimethylallyltransferase MiaA [Nitratireductor aquibiodomus]